jgi:tetratricopeptide (TPR) repeat protein
MVPLSPKLVQVLACLAEGRGELVSRELLLDRFWPDVTVTDNTLTRAIADIRQALGDTPGAPAYVQTLARRGYRFVAPVAEETAPPDRALPGVVAVSEAVAGLEPFVAWERGRSTLESLSITTLPAAAEAFSRAVAGAPHYAPAHAGLANAHIFRYEATRVDNVPDVAALTAAVAAATRATELDPTLGEGWAALGHALGGARRVEESRAALRQAVALEPRNWRHHYRMAVCTWGEERLRAVERAEALLPGFPATQTLAVMVLVARQSLEFAVAAAARGAAAQAAQYDRSPYPASGLLWLQGLTAAASGDHAAALDHFVAEETTSRGASTVYARECLVLALEAKGFTHLALGDVNAAGPAFQAAAAASPGHGRATLGLAIAGGEEADGVERVTSACTDMARVGKHGECALLLAAAHAWGGRADEGLAVAEQALVTTSPDATGWSLPADPLFAPLRTATGYDRLAARLGSRAS